MEDGHAFDGSCAEVIKEGFGLVNEREDGRREEGGRRGRVADAGGRQEVRGEEGEGEEGMSEEVHLRVKLSRWDQCTLRNGHRRSRTNHDDRAASSRSYPGGPQIRFHHPTNQQSAHDPLPPMFPPSTQQQSHHRQHDEVLQRQRRGDHEEVVGTRARPAPGTIHHGRGTIGDVDGPGVEGLQAVEQGELVVGEGSAETD